MTKFLRQRKPTLSDTTVATVVALGAAAVAFYLVRTLVSKEELESRVPAPPESTPANVPLAPEGVEEE